MRIDQTFMLLLVGLLGCVEPYDFQVSETVEILAIEAEFSNELVQHQVKLSISRALDEDQITPLSGAMVWIMEDEVGQINFVESEGGLYETENPVAGKIGSSYVLNIRLEDGTTYQSTTEVLTNPVEIDSVYGKYLALPSQEDDAIIEGIQFFVDTHDLTSEASYFRYEYVEDYQVKVPYPSRYEWDFETESFDLREIPIGTCYAHGESLGLIIATTNGLSENRLNEFPIRMVERSDAQLNQRYSIILKQYALSPGAYQYYKNLKENNESAGSFFDKQKGTIAGNIAQIGNTASPVLGFFEVAGVSSDTSFFISSEFGEQGFRPDKFYGGSCNPDVESDTVNISDLNNTLMETYNIVDIPIMSPNSAILFTRPCSDCRVYADINKPEYWD
ncbi:protein of unknown function [Reichenbachiella faecimaris]|uniref:DUF4249 domain-containing protein n=1 Tax=Reichenbachiella faecimaris TaxID=692418 RepID=A0A1W2G6M8_REIFA|nr:DUF4249 domain-containing protein [Reichenbachiella faecimaris]SMD32273.1 protein of unknown function [Reichenbachiella faecimaris]